MYFWIKFDFAVGVFSSCFCMLFKATCIPEKLCGKVLYIEGIARVCLILDIILEVEEMSRRTAYQDLHSVTAVSIHCLSAYLSVIHGGEL
jgi:hypothetical protein